MEPVADRAPADHRQLRVDVHRARTRYEEEARLEVLQVVDRERIQPLAVHGQDPSGEEAGVEREQAGRIGERRLDVAARVADHERVAVEDRDEIVAHAPFLRRSWKRTLEREQQPAIALERDRSAEERRHRVLLTARDAVEERLGRRARRSRPWRSCARRATSPFVIVISQRTGRAPPLLRSKRIVPVIFSSAGSCPRAARARRTRSSNPSSRVTLPAARSAWEGATPRPAR